MVRFIAKTKGKECGRTFLGKSILEHITYQYGVEQAQNPDKVYVNASQ
jgi:hypothetical protein